MCPPWLGARIRTAIKIESPAQHCLTGFKTERRVTSTIRKTFQRHCIESRSFDCDSGGPISLSRSAPEQSKRFANRCPRGRLMFLTTFAQINPQVRTQTLSLDVVIGCRLLIACLLGSLLLPTSADSQDLVPVKPPLSNEKSGVDIDRYVGHPLKSVPGRTHETIIKRPILTHGSPSANGSNRAVLEYRKELFLGTLGPKDVTPPVALDTQLFFFVASGEGRIDDGSGYWDLQSGFGVLVPPRLRHRITNVSDKPFELLMLTWEPSPDVSLAKQILVRDTHQMPLTDCGGEICHWSYLGKNIFNPSHGLHPNESFHVVYVPPMTIGEPHAHVPGWEEVWTKLPPHTTYFMLGSEVREMPPFTAFLSPPNSKTVHSVINLSKDQTMAWLFISHFTVKQPDYGREPLVPRKDLPSLTR
jgi:mannose-6-phosphate isomerase-like protein (cupin superfamily)